MDAEETSCWMCTGERQSARIRAKYLRATLRQDVGYFDSPSSSTAEVVNNVAADATLVQEAMSEKVNVENFTFATDVFNSRFSDLVLWCRWGIM
jgi:ATP-binding cassette subfamily B (MDR/TAP) protein 1